MSRQSEFAQAILNPDRPVPQGLRTPQGAAAGKRFSVYRNNVAVSLSEALEATFPIIRKLVGDEFFKAMAGVFLRQYQPNSPVLMFYGTEMPVFLEGFEPVTHLGYLPDIARIELALCRSYHAANTPPLDPTTLQAITPDDLLEIHLHLAPSVHLICSKWPAGSIFHANSSGGSLPAEMHPEDILITRPEFDPQVTVLPAGAGALIAALIDNAPLGEALKQATITSGDFDLTETLGLLLTAGAITKTTEGAK